MRFPYPSRGEGKKAKQEVLPLRSLNWTVVVLNRPIGGAAEGIVDALNLGLAAAESRNADRIGARHEDLRPESEHDAVADRRFGGALQLDHAVIVDRCRCG